MDPNDWRIVRATPLFSAMPEAAARDFLGAQSVRVYEKGSLLFQQGEPASCFFVMLDGWVKVYRMTPEGSEAVVGVFRRGETFAEAAIFLGGRFPVAAETVSTCRLLRIDGEHLRRRIREQPDLALSMLASASYHLKFLVEQLEQIKLLTAPQRVADFLVGLCRSSSGRQTVELPYDKMLLANRLGMKPESLSRALAKLRPIGVAVERELVSIDNVQALRDFVAVRSEND